jgi:hypothetical protein
VDGLQRLTTLTILICVLRDLGSDDEPGRERLLAAIGSGQGPDARHRLSLGGADEEDFFLEHVRAPGATRAGSQRGAGSPSERCILEVRDHFLSELADLDAERRRQLAEFLLERCWVVQVTTTDIDRAHHMFTVLNATGKPLARNDILKAMLLGGVPQAAAVSCLAIWKEAETRLGEHFESLFSHIWWMHGRPGPQIITGIVRIAEERGGPQAFIERVLRPAADVFDRIRKAKDGSGTDVTGPAAQYLRYLGWHGFADWIPPTMLWWLENGEDGAGFAAFLKKLDRLASGMRFLGIGGSKRQRRFGAVATAIRNRRNLDGPDSPLGFSRQELRTIQHNLRDLHARNAPAAKHLLLRLTDVAAGRPESSLLPGDMTVEHILPKKVGADSLWRSWYSDPEQREACTESLGNLVLVTKAQNDKAGNLDFRRKHEIYFATPGEPVPAINEGVRRCAEWKPEQVKAREAQLLALVRQLWGFDLPPPAVPSQNGAKPRSR